MRIEIEELERYREIERARKNRIEEIEIPRDRGEKRIEIEEIERYGEIEIEKKENRER